MSEVTYMREVWLKRAKVASDCAAELGELSVQLGRLVRANYFGAGCVEGQELFDQLTALLRGGTQSLSLASSTASDLASASESAADEIQAADETVKF